MRRNDREITDRDEIGAILHGAMVCRLGLADGDGPYIVPMSFGYEDGVLWLHSAPEPPENRSGSSPGSSMEVSDGKKIAMIRKDPRCCFEADICDRVIRRDNPCSWGMQYRSVIGFGRAEIATDPEEKRHGLTCIMRHYGGGTREFSEKDLHRVAVIRIDIESMTGKKA
jgi:nitroimidazol reductase NimA-like FMN-containing flavoprotein (pyridoxamine 5'-phosphate oxidase superfamily)